jgi:hypothetical protein
VINVLYYLPLFIRWRYLHVMGLSDSPLCRRHGAEDETSAHILCECEALASLRHVYLGSLFLEPEDIKSTRLKGHLELLWSNRAPMNWYKAQRASQLRPRCIQTVRSRTQSPINQSIFPFWPNFPKTFTHNHPISPFSYFSIHLNQQLRWSNGAGLWYQSLWVQTRSKPSEFFRAKKSSTCLPSEGQ